MTKKILVATVIFVFLLVSSVWASPPGGAKMDEYMNKRYVIAYVSGGAVFVDFKKVTHIINSVSDINYTIHFDNGKDHAVHTTVNGRGSLDESYTFTSVWTAWQNYLRFLKDNPQFHSIP